MNAILIHALYALSGVSAFAALHHALIAWRHPVNRTHLWFALLCVAIAVYVLAKAGAYGAATAEALVRLRRWELSFAIVFFALFPWFVREYTGQRSLRLPLVLSLSMGVVLMANLLLPYGVGFTHLPEFARVTLPWGEQVADLRAHQRGTWFHIGRGVMILVFIYSLYASWRQYHRGERRRALILALAIAVFLICFTFNQLVNQGVVEFIHTAEFGFLALLFVMGQSLAYDMREIEQRMQAVLDNMPAVVYVKDLLGRYQLVNRRFGESFRNDNPGVRGRTDYELFPAEQADRLRADDTRVVDGREPLQFEETLELGGETRHFITCKFPIFAPDGTLHALGGTSMDVTELRNTENERDTLRDQMLHADRVARVSALSTSLAHELSQPLTAMLSNAQAGLRFLEQGAPGLGEFRDILQDIVRDDKRAIALINGLRAMLRQQSSSRVPIVVADTVTEVLELLHGEIAGRAIECEYTLNEGVKVLADKVQISQVVLNLLMNALDALDGSPEGQRRLHVSVASDGDGQVRVAVRDTGIGLPPNQLDRVFDAFYSSKPQGLGMGLALCRSIVESHGGRIWANDNDNQGATVQFVLPIAKESQV